MLSIIIPAHNEENRIVSTLKEYMSYFRGKEAFEIVVVTNGCSDRTPEIVSDMAKKNPEIVHIDFKSRIGKGGAIIKGFEAAKGDLVAYTDADMATEPKELHKLFSQLEDYDAVIGSRWVDGSVIVKEQPLGRIVASRGFNLLVRLVLGLPVKDSQCGAKIFRKGVVKSLTGDLTDSNWAFDATLLYALKKKGFRMKEVPTVWEDKAESKLKMRKVVPRMFYAVVKLRIKDAFRGKPE